MQKKQFGDDFVVVEFHEHPVIDHSKEPVKLFDVSTKGHADFAPDFVVDGKFNQQWYCLCLLECAFRLEEGELSSFLDYQCARVKEPYLWLTRFDCLLNNNSNYGFIRSRRLVLHLLIQLTEEKRDMHAAYVVKRKTVVFNWNEPLISDDRFNIVKVKEALESIPTLSAKKRFLLRRRTDFLQEIEHNTTAQFIQQVDLEIAFLDSTGIAEDMTSSHKRIVFRGTPSQLSDLIFQLKSLKDKNSNLLFDGATATYARLVCTFFCQENGEGFNESSIRKFLTNYNGGKRPRKGNRIDASGLGFSEED